MFDQIVATLRALPFLAPGLLLAVLVAWRVLRRGLRLWATATWLGWAVLLAALALDPAGGVARHACDLTRWVPLAASRWLEMSSDALNVWVFALLGLLGAWTHWPRLATLLGALLPFGFEAAQTLLPRDCTSFDVANNLAGLGVGLCVGAGVRLLLSGAPR